MLLFMLVAAILESRTTETGDSPVDSETSINSIAVYDMESYAHIYTGDYGDDVIRSTEAATLEYDSAMETHVFLSVPNATVLEFGDELVQIDKSRGQPPTEAAAHEEEIQLE